ncbi:MAG: phospholipid carrier-dependent glycosyltransferase [Proteobacteria bacterium]|nr:phospholipid carrier-dependent glycosyltransferase [Pseudomonadota bacterium]
MNDKIKTLFYCFLVLTVSYFTYFHDYYKPDMAYYDEHHYIIHAERYIHRIVFFDTNPPLGKMFIALGEKLFNPNKNVNMEEQLERGYIFLAPMEGFSFVGVRFFPALFGLLNGLLIFLIFYGLSKNHFLSLMFGSLYLFENSSIVHFRGALLDSTLVFFSFLTILYFIYLYEKKEKKTLINYFVLGLLTGLAVFTKMVGFILVLLLLFLLFKELKVKELFKQVMSYLLGLCVICFAVYYIHVALGSNIILDHDIRDMEIKVGASNEYIQMIKNKDIYNPLKLYIPMKDYFNYMRAPKESLPMLNAEIGSSPLGWPIGIKNISYVFAGDEVNSNKWWYLNFQGNPVNWGFGLLALLLSVCLIIAKITFKIKISNTRIYSYILIFTSLYVGYMITVTLIAMERILYIHTYLLPLFFSFILFFLVFNYIFEEYIIKKDKVLYVLIFLLMAQIFYVYYLTSPVTYGKSITYLECEKTRLINFWEDDCTYE